MSEGGITPEEFAEAFQRVATWAHIEERSERSPFKAMLTDHFGDDPATFPITGESIALYDLPNLQLAMEAYLGTAGTEHRLVGFGGPVGFTEMTLSGLVHDVGFGLVEGPVRRAVVSLEAGRSLPCVTAGLYLISSGGEHLAALVVQGQRGYERRACAST